MEQLTTEMILVMSIIGITLFLFVIEWVRVDVVAILIMVALPLLKLINPKNAFMGFSSNAVISIIAVIIIGSGLDKTGVINKIVSPILKIAGTNASRIIIYIATTVGVISSFMQNIGAAALFLPAIQRISKATRIPIGRLLMPIGYCAILGGTITLVGSSPLILLNDLLEPFQLKPFHLFDVTPIGLALLASGILFFVVFGKFVLPKGDEQAQGESTTELYETSSYQDIKGPFELRTHDDYADYKDPTTVGDLFDNYMVKVVALAEPSDIKITAPGLDTEILANRDLAVYGFEADVRRMAEEEDMKFKASLEAFKGNMDSAVAGTVEAVVSPRSTLVGKTLMEMNFRELYRVNPMAIYRGGQVFYSVIDEISLRVGDAILLQGPWDRFKILEDKKDLIFPPIEIETLKPEKAVPACIWLTIALIMIMVFKIQLSVCLMTGALGMILTRVLSIDEAYDAVDWRTIFLLGGLIPLGKAAQDSGTAAWIAHMVLGMIGDVTPVLLLTVVAILSTFFTLVISNVGATVLLVPLVINMAIAAGFDTDVQRMTAMVVGLATSNSFMLPTHQVNALYMGPGRYQSKDFIKAGFFESILFIVVLITIIYFFYI